MFKKWWIIISLLLLSIAMIIPEARIPWPKENVSLVSAAAFKNVNSHLPGTIYSIVDENGKIITRMSMPVSIGDYLITEDNRGFTIRELKGQKAIARFDGHVNLLGTGTVTMQAGNPRGPVGIYHSHSDESYVPSSGKPTEQWGDIYKVGDTLAQTLRKRGLKVIHSYNNHNPHDAASYMRSRRTVAQLLKSRPSLLIDVHRDAIPDADYYRKHVQSNRIASMRVVVGKQNANRSVNFYFDKMLKEKAYAKYPGLVKEIFWARGNYNQDVAPRTILFEFGTHTNSLQEAQQGAAMMANVIADVLGTAGGRVGTPNMSRSGWWTAGWIIGLLLLGAGIFLALNSDSWQKVKNMLSKEVVGSLGTEEDTEQKNDNQNNS